MRNSVKNNVNLLFTKFKMRENVNFNENSDLFQPLLFLSLVVLEKFKTDFFMLSNSLLAAGLKNQFSNSKKQKQSISAKRAKCFKLQNKSCTN